MAQPDALVRENALSNEDGKKIMRDALQAGLSAKTVIEFDEPLQKLGALREQLRKERSTDPEGQLREASRLAAFLRRLQDFVGGFRHGPQDGSADLHALQESEYDFSDLGPRSLVMERLKALMPAEETSLRRDPFLESKRGGREILARVHSLDDLPAAKVAIDALEIAPEERWGIDSLASVYDEVKKRRVSANQFYNVINLSNDSRSSVAPLRPLCDELLNRLLPLALGLPADEGIKLSETREEFFARIQNQAQQKQDWMLALKLISLSNTLRITSSNWENDMAGFNGFLAGANNERAGQYAFAVACYSSALSTGSQVLPIDLIRQRMEKIKGDHPDDYAEGLRISGAALITGVVRASDPNPWHNDVTGLFDPVPEVPSGAR